MPSMDISAIQSPLNLFTARRDGADFGDGAMCSQVYDESVKAMQCEFMQADLARLEAQRRLAQDLLSEAFTEEQLLEHIRQENLRAQTGLIKVGRLAALLCSSWVCRHAHYRMCMQDSKSSVKNSRR